MNEKEFNNEIKNLYRNLHKILNDDELLKELEHIKYGEGIVSLYSAAWTIIECKLVISRNDYIRLSQLITMGHMSNDNQRYIRELLDRVDDDMIDRLFKD